MSVAAQHFVQIMAAKKIGQYIQDIDRTILEHPNKKDDNSLQVRYDLPLTFTNRHFIETIQKLYEGAGWNVEHNCGSDREHHESATAREFKNWNYLVFTPK